MDWGDFANALGTVLPGLSMVTVVSVVGVVYLVCRLGWVLSRTRR